MQKIQEFIIENLIQQKNSLFLWAPVFFAVGIAVYFGLKAEPPLWFGAIAFALALSAVLSLRKRQYNGGWAKGLFLFNIALALSFSGFTVAQFRTQLVYTPMLVKKLSPVGVTGTIESIEPLGEGQGSRVVLSELEIERLQLKEMPRKIRLKIRKDEALRAGQRINVLAGLNPASPPVAPGAFDFQRMAYFQGIGAVGFAYNAPVLLEERRSKGQGLETLRRILSDKITAKTDGAEQSVLIALMTGQRQAIADEDWDAFRASGLAHLLAISGLHVGMVAGVLFFFARFAFALFPSVVVRYPIKKWAALIALSGAFAYTFIVGATIPTQRALIMTGLMMIAILFDRSPFSMRLVAVAALAILCVSPESLTSVSFQMSFAAVTALICFYEAVRRYWSGFYRQASWSSRVGLYFTGVLMTTVIAGTATGLFALYHFQNFALYGVLANLVAVPLMAFIVMPLLVLSYILMPFGLEGLILPFAEWGMQWILATAHWTAGLEGALWLVPTWPHWIFICMVLCLWTWMVWQSKARHIMVPMFLVLLGSIFFYKQPDILISSKLDLISIHSDSGSLWLSTGQKERYSAESWLRRHGQAAEEKKIWPKEGGAEGFPLTCDPYGCRGEVKGQKVAIAFSKKAVREDCDWADVMIAQMPVENKNCQAAIIIDYFDVWREGAQAVWLSPEGVKIQTVDDVRGKRPWTQTAANKKKR